MGIQNKDAVIAEIERFKEEALKMHIVQVLADTYERSNLFDYSIDSDGSVIWYKAQARQLWDFWQAKAQAVPECTWSRNEDYYFDTSCGNNFMFTECEDKPSTHQFKHCCYCGGKLIEAQEQKVTNMKIAWGMECPKCNHNEATIHSTAEKDSGYEFMHGDSVVCLNCGNTGEMDANGEDSDIVWNEDESQEPAND